jgi:uncharacterized membrane protein YdjX (TVP38/TMEM64 family)
MRPRGGAGENRAAVFHDLPSAPGNEDLMRRKPLLLVGFLLLAIAGYAAVRHYLPLETIIEYEARLRSAVDRYPRQSFFTGLIFYTLLSFVPGTTGKSIIFGWLFGFWIAFLQVNLALTAAALGSFFVSRYLFRDAVQSRFGFYIARFDKAIARSGGVYVMSLRMLHAPYTFVNYAMGASSIRWTTFWWSSQLGLLPGNVVFVLAGAQLPSLQTLSRDGVHAAFSPMLIVAFLLMAAFPIAVQHGVRSWRRAQGMGTKDLTS